MRTTIVPAKAFWPRALSGRFRRTRLLIIGCGDVGQDVARRLQAQSGITQRHGQRVLALSSSLSAQRRATFLALGVLPIGGNLDMPHTLRRLGGVAHRVLYLAPPPAHGTTDPRMQAALAALRRGTPPRAWVYASTSGVYGDCGGAWIDETRTPTPRTSRGQRRWSAERQLRTLPIQQAQTASKNRYHSPFSTHPAHPNTRVAILRIPGIYSLTRRDGGPRTRLEAGTPVLHAADDVYVNHIHAHDLARACIAALWRGGNGRVFHICDDGHFLVGDYFDLAADILNMPRPPRISREQAHAYLRPTQMSFLEESRRMKNHRMKTELKLRLQYPTVREGLRADLIHITQ